SRTGVPGALSAVCRTPCRWRRRGGGMTQASRLPLAGVRVLDLSRLMAGNMLTLQLADFGADVIKVESPQGDTLRDWKNGGKSIWWKVYARNKRSICLNLKQESDRARLLAMIPQAQ